MSGRDLPSATYIAASADVADTAILAGGVHVWHLAQVRERASIGKHAVIGRGAYVGTGVHIGENSKVQNYALIYEPAILADGVFVGPSVVLTNDTYPRAINAEGQQKNAEDWDPVGVTIERGASIGARAVCIAPIKIGEWAMVAAGAVVTSDVPNYALVAGVPAKRIGWVGRSGRRLRQDRVVTNKWHCPETDVIYVEDDGKLYESQGEHQ